jgi:hypothetical protein
MLVSGNFGHGTATAKAGDVAIDEMRMPGVYGAEVETFPLQCTGAPGGDENIGTGCQGVQTVRVDW